MQQYTIVSDSSCDLPEEFLKKLNISIVPYYVSFDKVHYYKELVDLSVAEFYHKVVAEKLFPCTSLPPIQDYYDIFEKELKNGKDIICMCLSAKFSGSYQSAINAKLLLSENYPDRRIEVVDSIMATGGQGLLVYEAAMMQASGYSLDMVVEKCNRLKESARINFTVDSLEHLQKGGRIGKASALAGSLLNIKPIIIMENGELVPINKVRGKKKALQTILDMTLKEIGSHASEYDACIINASRGDDVAIIEKTLSAAGISYLKPIFDVGITIGTHAGPTAIGICYIKRFDSLDE